MNCCRACLPPLISLMRDRIEIRKATEADLEAIAHVLVDTWRTTFRGLLADAFLDGMTYARQEERDRRTMGGARAAYFVAVDARSSEVVGFVNGGPNRQPDYPYPAEIYAFYIRQAWQHRGIGGRLFRAIAAEFLASGSQALLVWVLADNSNRGFYQRLGGHEIAV